VYQNIFISWKSSKPIIHLWDDQKGHAMFPFKKYAYQKDRSGNMRSLYGDKLKKVTFWKKEDTPKLFEADIHPEMRTLVDMYHQSDEPSINHRVLFFDIETEVLEGFPDWQNPINRVLSFTIYDQQDDMYYVGALDVEGKLTLESKDNTQIEVFSTEDELLKYFIRLIKQTNPTILSGWNIDKFDIPYLYSRMCVVLGTEMANQVSPIGVVVFNKGQNVFKIAGISSLDYYRLYMKFSMGERPSYKLDDIGDLEVGVKKIKYEGTLNDLYEKDMDLFIKYNINDVVILKLLDEKLNYIDVAKSLAHKGHVPYESIYSTSHLLDGAILTFLKRKGIIAPSKANTQYITHSERDERITGAFVKSPQVGMHKWVFDIDAASMYPNIMMSLNISPETKVGRVIGWNAERFASKKQTDYQVQDLKGNLIGSYDHEEMTKYLDSNKVAISAHGILYRTDIQGLIPSILNEWFSERVEFKKLRKKFFQQGNKSDAHIFDIKQYTQKILLNSMYGAAALPVFRYYDLDNAMSVTTTGQSMIKYAERAGNYYYKSKLGEEKDYCIYIDTDSLFFSALPLIQKNNADVDVSDHDKMVELTLSECEKFQDYINESLSMFAKRMINLDDHRFVFKQEVIAPNGIFISKKRYSLWIIDQEGMRVDELLVKGIDIVRSNFPKSFKVLLTDVITGLLKGKDKDSIDDIVISFKQNMKNEPIEDIAMSTGVKKIKKFLGPDKQSIKGTPAHVRSAINYNSMLKDVTTDTQYTEIVGGDKIKWVYLKTNPYGINKIAFKATDNPSEIMSFVREFIDINTLYEKLAFNKIQTFYEAVKWALPVDPRNTLMRFF
jgi:DNA polymerase elongation subunit (family B)